MAERLLFPDFARGYAIFLIVLFHYSQRLDLGPWLEKAMSFGGTGTHLFIFLSGFGLSLSPVGWGYFFRRRFVSVLLPYYVFVTFAFLFNLIVPIYPHEGIFAYAGHLLLFKMFDNRVLFSYGFQLWFISTLVQLYLSFPLLRLLQRKTGNTWFLIVSLGVSTGYWFFLYRSDFSSLPVMRVLFLQFLWEFSLGMVAADLYTRGLFVFWRQKPVVSLMLAIIGTAAMGAMALKGGAAGTIFNDVPAFFGFTFLCIAVYGVANRYFGLLRDGLVRLGRSSYPLFLVHMFPLALVSYVLAPKMHLSIVQFLLLLPLVILLSRLYQAALLFLAKPGYPLLVSGHSRPTPARSAQKTITKLLP